MNKHLIAILFLFLLLPCVAAFSPSTDVSYVVQCSNCTSVNSTVLELPNGSLVSVFQSLQSNGALYYGVVNKSLTSSMGDYKISGNYNPNSLLTPWSFEFTITNPQNPSLPIGEAIIYFLLLVLSFGLCVACGIAGFLLPYDNVFDGLGVVKKINRWKYVKFFAIEFSMLFFLWFVSILNGVAFSYMNDSYFTSWVGNAYLLTYAFATATTVIMLLVTFIHLFMDIFVHGIALKLTRESSELLK